MPFVRKYFSLEAANFSLFSQEGEVTSPLISGPTWTLRLQFSKYQQRLCPNEIFLFFFFCNSTYSLYPEHWIIQEPIYVLHHITCHGRIMPRLAELLFYLFIFPICLKYYDTLLYCYTHRKVWTSLFYYLLICLKFAVWMANSRPKLVFRILAASDLGMVNVLKFWTFYSIPFLPKIGSLCSYFLK